ncbi:MAG: hypothetical protein LRZ97_00890 [Candidatus Pacebacteria bacterium]|nr:hypothetical protein [Candidatus Paceibacterota bacterium]
MFKVFYRYGQKYIAVLLLFRDDVKKLFHTTTPVTLSNKSINIIAIMWIFSRLFGPEYRDILILWRNNPQVKFRGVDSREPTSQHWKETCKYYVDNFPEPYISKWQERVGKAIHYESDFGRALYNWDDVKNCGIELNK